MIIEIESNESKKFKDFTKLSQKKYRSETGTYLLESYQGICDYINNDEIKALIFSGWKMYEDFLEVVNIEDLENKMDIYILKENLFNKLSENVSKRGVMALCTKKKYIVDFTKNTIYLDDIRDPGNLGTIIRSAVAFNFVNIIISHSSVDVYNPKVLRSTMGAIFKCNILIEDLENVALEFQNNNYEILGGTLDGDSLYSYDGGSKKPLLCIGNESKGLSNPVLDVLDRKLTIPMETMESLNASVAASIFMSKFYR